MERGWVPGPPANVIEFWLKRKDSDDQQDWPAGCYFAGDLPRTPGGGLDHDAIHRIGYPDPPLDVLEEWCFWRMRRYPGGSYYVEDLPVLNADPTAPSIGRDISGFPESPAARMEEWHAFWAGRRFPPQTGTHASITSCATFRCSASRLPIRQRTSAETLPGCRIRQRSSTTRSHDSSRTRRLKHVLERQTRPNR
jgi:hypothetical protein